MPGILIYIYSHQAMKMLESYIFLKVNIINQQIKSTVTIIILQQFLLIHEFQKRLLLTKSG